MGLGIDGGGEGQGGDSQGGGADEGEAWWTEIIMGIDTWAQNMLRKPVKRLRKLRKLLEEKKYRKFAWYLIGTSIHGAFSWSVIKLLHSRFGIEYTVLISSQLVGKVVNKALKLHFNQKRPSASGKTSNGMPSYHSQHAFFFASYLIQNSIIPPEYWPLPISAACLVAYSRVGIQMHSFDQVIVGSCVGMAQSWFSTLLVTILKNKFLSDSSPMVIVHII
mmetsp:Transcript_26593/g.42749  ORF Transcript_26593/g.42749 Transcript_26593/m.42749 type:complete len:220 (+) Transcript_26593:52-711(+)